MDEDHEEPMAKVAGKLIQAKEIAENLGAPTTFSGFGSSEEPANTDPVYNLRQLVKEQYKSEIKHKKTQKGGFLPLVPIATAAAGALAAKITSELFDFVKKKLNSSGSGVNIPNHKTKDQKIQFMKEFINCIK